jgi:3-(3-hydroxy-phenyl)propionate hydroxylase
VNSGRLSTPTPYLHSSLNTADTAPFAGRMLPGTNCADAPVRAHGRDGWLLHQLGGDFVALSFGAAPQAQSIEHHGIRCRVLDVGRDLEDPEGLLAARYDAEPGTTYLIRPDQHVAARWRHFEPAAICAAIDRATGRG